MDGKIWEQRPNRSLLPNKMNSTLSRHLYRLDEVKASLRYSLVRRCRSESMFWAMELIDSMEGFAIVEILLYCWLYSAPYLWTFGHAVLQLAAKDEMDTDELLQLVYAASGLPEKDSSVVWLLSCGSEAWETQADFVGNIEIPEEFLGRSPEIQCFIRALLQGKSLFAWTLIRHAWTDDTWNLLRTCAKQKGVREDVIELLNHLETNEMCRGEFRWESRATAILFVTNAYRVSRRKQPHTLGFEIHPHVVVLMKDWASAEGRRERRAFPIRPEAILWNCERSKLRNTESNIDEIREPFRYLKGCSYWEMVAEDMGGWKAIRKSDDHKEAFYDLYFPDDIPDEWSTTDQEKSHGRGVLIGSITEENQYIKYIRGMFLGFVSNGLEITTKTAVNLPQKHIGWTTIYEDTERLSEWSSAVEKWRLSPVRKKILLLQ
jgi:hypothetical protein